MSGYRRLSSPIVAIGLTGLPAAFIFGLLIWRVFQRGGSLWEMGALAVLGLGLLVFPLLSAKRAAKQRTEDIDALVKSAGAGRAATDIKLESMQAPAAPRVLRQGLPDKLELTRKMAGSWLIGGLLVLVFAPVLLLGVKAGNPIVVLVGITPLALFCLFMTRRLPKKLMADPQGLWIDEQFKPWTAINGITEQRAGTGTLRLSISWAAVSPPGFAWSQPSAGGLSLDLAGYAGRRKASEDAFACMAIWHYRAKRAVQDAEMQAKTRAKFDRFDALFKTDPAAAERAVEQDLSEMEAKMRELGVAPAKTRRH